MTLFLFKLFDVEKNKEFKPTWLNSIIHNIILIYIIVAFILSWVYLFKPINMSIKSGDFKNCQTNIQSIPLALTSVNLKIGNSNCNLFLNNDHFLTNDCPLINLEVDPCGAGFSTYMIYKRSDEIFIESLSNPSCFVFIIYLYKVVWITNTYDPLITMTILPAGVQTVFNNQLLKSNLNPSIQISSTTTGDFVDIQGVNAQNVAGIDSLIITLKFNTTNNYINQICYDYPSIFFMILQSLSISLGPTSLFYSINKHCYKGIICCDKKISKEVKEDDKEMIESKQIILE
jgi:hypothetical protein